MTCHFFQKNFSGPSGGAFGKLVLLLFSLGIFLSVLHTLWAYDVWWHLKAGEVIWKEHFIPGTNLFSYTAPEHPWIDLSWGFQLFIYIAYKLFGASGIILFKAAVVTSIFLLLLKGFSRSVPLLVLLPVLALILFTAHERLVERPEVVSYLFLVSFLLILEKDRKKPSKTLYALPLLQILWANTHALFVLGLLVIASAWLGAVLSWLTAKKRLAPVSFPSRLTAVFVLSSLATLVNPYGAKGALFPLTLLTRISGEFDVFTYGIGEFTRPFLTGG
ncbi:MAG: hypothetical protein ABH845_00450, partial [Candidatus Omnitrophota bacterium]